MLPATTRDIRPALRYALAIAIVAGATAAHVALRPALGPAQPYLAFTLGVTLVAGLVGTRAAVVAVGASLVAATCLLPARPSEAIAASWLLATAFFLFVSAVTLLLFESLRLGRAHDALHAARLHALADASIAIGSASTLRATLQAVTRAARGLLDAARAEVQLVEEVRRPGSGVRLSEGAASDAPPGGPPARATLRAHDGRPIGTLAVSPVGGRRFTADDRTILQQLALHASVAVENARAEDALRASTLRYRTLVEATGAIVWRADAAGRIIEAPGWASITGTPPDAGEPLGWLDAVHADDRRSLAGLWTAARREHRSIQAEFRIRAAAGGHRWVSLRGVPIRAAGGAVQEWIGTLTDVTALRRADGQRAAVLREAKRARMRAATAAERLRRVQRIVDVVLSDVALEPLLRQLLAHIVAVVDAESAVILLREDDGFRVRAAVGVPDANPHDARVPLDAGFPGAVARERRPVVWAATEVGDADPTAYVGTAGMRSLLGVPLRVDERLLGVLHVGRTQPRRFGEEDVELLRLAAARIALGVELAAQRDAERHAREVLDAANRAKDEFLAMLGHELRNPLAAIRNAVIVARFDPARGGVALDIARRQSEHLGRLVDDLLDVARITRGTIVLRRERVTLQDVVTRAVDALQSAADERGHALEVALPETPIEVDGDATRLVQVVSNLLDNAIRYTPSGGNLRVALDRRDGAARLRVRDDGPGIPGELAPHLFEAFSQGARSLDRSSGGLGIGLTVVKRIVELHGGRVSVDDEPSGRGSEFTIELPADVGAPASTGVEIHLDSPEDRGPRARLLVVEDNVETADAFEMLLQQLGHDVEVVHDGRAAIEAVRAHTPDLALIDIGLPGIDGYEVAKTIRRERRDGPMLVAVTGYGRPEDRARALASGFDRHLVKPIELAVLRDVLRSLPERRAAG